MLQDGLQAAGHHAQADDENESGGEQRGVGGDAAYPGEQRAVSEVSGPVAEADQEQSDGGECGRHAEAVGQHEGGPEDGPAQCDRAEEDDQCGRAGDEASGDA